MENESYCHRLMTLDLPVETSRRLLETHWSSEWRRFRVISVHMALLSIELNKVTGECVELERRSDK